MREAAFTVEPCMALVFYKQQLLTKNSQLESDYSPVATIHEVESEKMQEGRTIDVDHAYRLLRGIVESNGDSASVNDSSFIKVLPENVLYQERNTLAWWSPSRMTRLWFRLNGGKPKSFMRRTPALFWLSRESELVVFALGSNQRPSGQSELFHTPLMNTYEDGRVCWGGKRPNVFEFDTLAEGMASVEHEYLEATAFSHVNGGPRLNIVGRTISETDDLYRYWKSKSEKANRFSYSHLVPIGRTVSGMIGGV
ncbi:hypothetical protein [Reinekea sp. G2M2-21]|uniref:hypothetical protein n=1 Tax=Reinekea sp. G2M2-21 TaxID=2788942 RepID=UPI0018AAB442|nr:hypothetical protein [Reinekea sp. G2M2-21]